MKKREEGMHVGRGSSEAKNEATHVFNDAAYGQQITALLAYSYWEARGCPHDSPHEDWFRAEAEPVATVPTEEAELHKELI